MAARGAPQSSSHKRGGTDHKYYNSLDLPSPHAAIEAMTTERSLQQGAAALPPILGLGSPPQNQPTFSGARNSQRQTFFPSRRGGQPQNGDRNQQAHPNARPIPTGPHAGQPSRQQQLGGGRGGFEGARSPPNKSQYGVEFDGMLLYDRQLTHNKPDTSHVPCKFFREGNCQAGHACQFSHSTDASKFEQPCKYFAKGNCKFGTKCALLHVMQNGRIVNQPDIPGSERFGRVDPSAFQNQGSVLGDSLAQFGPEYHQTPFSHQLQTLRDYETVPGTQAFAQPYVDDPLQYSRYAEVHEEQQSSKAMSPPTVGLSTLDAPLPASFDSTGYSYMAQYGPVAASMPGAVGFEPLTGSLPKPIVGQSSKDRPRGERGREKIDLSSNISSSPEPPAELLNTRHLHSQRFPRTTKGLSASLPRYAHNIDPGWPQGDEVLFGGEEEGIPSDLSKLMSADERARRLSGKANPRQIRESLAGHNASGGLPTLKVGSPHVGSPSRFSELFKKQQMQEDKDNGWSSPDFGPIGSPLRSSSLHSGASPALRAASRNPSGNETAQVSSPQRDTTSVLSQQLQRSRIGASRASDEPGLHGSTLPGMRLMSSSRHYSDRVISGGSANTKASEDQPDIFSLDEEEEESAIKSIDKSIWGTEGISSPRRPSSLLTQQVEKEKSRVAQIGKEQDSKKQ